MTIPKPLQNGFLPPGIHDASIEEVSRVIVRGMLAKSELWLNLRMFLKEFAPLKGTVSDIFIDGSFVSVYPNSGDIDLLLVARNNSSAEIIQDFLEEFDPFSKRLDIKVAPGDEFPDPQGILDYFSRINPFKFPDFTGNKGILRLIP